MKILFDNALQGATLTAANESPNYPAENLKHQILKKRYQAVVDEDTIVMEWAAAVVVNCVYVGYTNASAMTLRLYDAGDALLKTVSVPAADLAVHFAAVAGVRTAELDVAAASGAVYVGGIGIGEEYSMPDPRNDWTDIPLDSSTVETSRDGQVFSNRIASLRSLPLSFYTIGFEDFREIRDLLSAVNRAVPVWADAFEAYHAEVMPIYGTLELGKTSKNDRKIDFMLTVTEAR
jgi:hypothetical protein